MVCNEPVPSKITAKLLHLRGLFCLQLNDVSARNIDVESKVLFRTKLKVCSAQLKLWKAAGEHSLLWLSSGFASFESVVSLTVHFHVICAGWKFLAFLRMFVFPGHVPRSSAEQKQTILFASQGQASVFVGFVENPASDGRLA